MMTSVRPASRVGICSSHATGDDLERALRERGRAAGRSRARCPRSGPAARRRMAPRPGSRRRAAAAARAAAAGVSQRRRRSGRRANARDGAGSYECRQDEARRPEEAFRSRPWREAIADDGILTQRPRTSPTLACGRRSNARVRLVLELSGDVLLGRRAERRLPADAVAVEELHRHRLADRDRRVVEQGALPLHPGSAPCRRRGSSCRSLSC